MKDAVHTTNFHIKAVALIALILAVCRAVVHLPPVWDIKTLTITVFQFAGALLSGTGERSGNNAAYSKFFVPAKAICPVSSRTGMVIIYILGLSISSYWLLAEAPLTARQTITAATLFIHYLKRELEVICVHKYSGSIDLVASSFISMFYGLAALGILIFTPDVSPSACWGGIGCGLFFCGQIGNGYHHWILRNLRKTKSLGSEKKYVIPTGGLFDLVTCPHYFFELVAWFGLALINGSVFAFLNFASMCNYLSGRAASTTSWYKGKFGDKFPRRRKHLVPFIF